MPGGGKKTNQTTKKLAKYLFSKIRSPVQVRIVATRAAARRLLGWMDFCADLMKIELAGLNQVMFIPTSLTRWKQYLLILFGEGKQKPNVDDVVVCQDSAGVVHAYRPESDIHLKLK